MPLRLVGDLVVFVRLLEAIRNVVELECFHYAVFLESPIVFRNLIHLFNVGLPMCVPYPLVVGSESLIKEVNWSDRLLGPKVDISPVDRSASLIGLASCEYVCLRFGSDNLLDLS